MRLSIYLAHGQMFGVIAVDEDTCAGKGAYQYLIDLRLNTMIGAVDKPAIKNLSHTG
ncbi:hypothetical protein DEV92_105247 [Phyllobacterium myrsinacearum]|jgi:hypothetical protein|nr:hypothetical protein DEV92_105247 [Phyllobacterium myrsinacearum]RZV05962.1 hypothetical protein EV654_3411 [Phyllobacterium myrsinacearum]